MTPPTIEAVGNGCAGFRVDELIDMDEVLDDSIDTDKVLDDFTNMDAIVDVLLSWRGIDKNVANDGVYVMKSNMKVLLMAAVMVTMRVWSPAERPSNE